MKTAREAGLPGAGCQSLPSAAFDRERAIFPGVALDCIRHLPFHRGSQGGCRQCIQAKGPQLQNRLPVGRSHAFAQALYTTNSGRQTLKLHVFEEFFHTIEPAAFLRGMMRAAFFHRFG